jgi:NAD(P)-dependent dehydrogenase (short-subunit alcohol dehydrogenase family)
VTAGSGTSLAGRVALVTGGNRGIGRAISTGLAEAGAAVGVFARNKETLEQVRAEIAGRGGRAEVVSGDVTDESAVREAVGHISRTLGPIDLLVNNAAAQTSIGDVAEVGPAPWWDDLRVNLLGPFLFMRHVLPQMIEQRRGCIVNVASNACWLPFPHVSSYNSAKAALVRCTETVAAEVRDHGIVAFSITPGQVRTALWEDTSAILHEVGAFGEVLGSIDPAFDSPELPAALVRTLAGGEMDELTGRFVGVHDDLEALREIVRRDPASDVGRLRIVRPAAPP